MSSERRAALVTGASRGIGEAVARGLAAQGHDLTLVGRTREALHSLADELAAAHDVRVVVAPADLSQEDDIHEVAATHHRKFDRLDVLVLNAGMGAIGALESFPLRRLDKLWTVNLRSAYVLVQDTLPLLRASGASSPWGGKIIAIASITGVSAEPLNSAYGATKAALVSLCETISTEHSHEGVTATALCPGYVATAMTAGLADSVPPETMLPVADVAALVLALTGLSKRTVIPQIVMTRPGPHLWRA